MAFLPFIEYFLRPVPGYTLLLQPLIEALSVRSWRRHGTPPAPRSIKVSAIRTFAPGRDTFVETGTFYGDTLAAVQDDFERLISIELHPRLARRAARRFGHTPRVRIVQGDSSDQLEAILREVGGPAVIWLDGHYSGMLTARGESGDTPVLRELDAVLRAGTSADAILVDDARLFGTDPAYPTIDQVAERMKAARPHCVVRVEDDIIQMTRRRAVTRALQAPPRDSS